MKKTALILMAVLAIPFYALAQDKFGYINSQELMQAMPERTKIEAELDTLAGQYENELGKMTEEYYGKIQEYQKNEATMPESIKQARQSEIADMEQRIQTFRQTAQSDIQKRQETLFGPVIEKVRKAIKEVGDEGGFTYIFDASTQVILYQSDKAVNVMPAVKAKLGIK